MIITRTPFRVSFAGGGSDFAEFYRHEPGCVVSTAINKYMYITLNRKFSGDIRVAYSRVELVSTVEEIEHPIVREALRLLGITGIEMTSNADVPSGTGLGSSASFTVGLLNALHTYRGYQATPEQLAKEAATIELEVLGDFAGRQDQYIVAYGGLRYIQFNSDASVFTEPIDYTHLEELSQSLMLLYLGESRDSAMYQEQMEDFQFDIRRKIRNLALELRAALVSGSPPLVIGDYLAEDWELKKQLAGGISSPWIEECYRKALDAGATGGKVAGAGGAGFLLLYCPIERQEAVKDATGLGAMDFSIGAEGSRVIYNDTEVHREP